MAKLAVIEGLDGCGKSTLLLHLLKLLSNTKKLAKRGSWLRESLKKAKDDKYACGYNIDTRYFLFLMSKLELSKKVQEDCSDVTYISNRWLAGEIALHDISARHHNVKTLDLCYDSFPILKPDKVIYLKPPFGVRIDRLNIREKGANYFDKMTMSLEAERIMQKNMDLIYGDNYLTIDNSQSIEHTVQQALDYIA